MENYLCAHTDFADRVEKMYPEAFVRVFPHVMFLVDCLCDENLGEMTDGQIESLTEEAMKRSGVKNDPPAGHTPNTMRDMTRAFMVREIREAHRRRRFPVFPPFFLMPYNSTMFDGEMDSGCLGCDFDGYGGNPGGFRDDRMDGFRDGFRDGDFNYDFEPDTRWDNRM